MVRIAARARVGAARSAAPRPRPRSATTRCTSRSGSTRTATSRSRSPSTATATASTSASATAPSSGATRRSSRRRPTPALDPTRPARELAERAVARGRGRRLRERRHARVPRRPRRQLLLHRDQLPDPGRAPGDRDADRHRPRREQIRIAAGEPLGFTQADIALRGHAIEFRINAEDPEHDFRPGAGVVERYHAPGGPGVRMDSHLYTGYEVPPYYDSLLGKLIVWGPDRPTAIARGRVALDGARHRGRRHQRRHPPGAARIRDVPRGRMTTNLLDRVGQRGVPRGGRPGMRVVQTCTCRSDAGAARPPRLTATPQSRSRP